MVEKVKQLPDIHEISVKGQRILDSLSEELEAEHFGKPIVIEAESGDYFIGETAEGIGKVEMTIAGILDTEFVCLPTPIAIHIALGLLR